MVSTPLFPLPSQLLHNLIERAIAEDIGEAGDITTLATIPANCAATAILNTRQNGVVAGIEIAAAVFRYIDPSVEITARKADGDKAVAGDPLMSVTGSARSLLTAERTALNLIGPMCGIATATRALVDAVDGTGVQITCTRKTMPGLRAIQKYAIRCGGGINHRFGLHDAVMIKDNHIIAAGGIAPALRAAKAYAGHTVKIEIEVDTLNQLHEVLAEGADIILLDNMPTATLLKAVTLAKGQAVLEASGNVTLDTVKAIAETGVDVISSGAITHSAKQLDIGLEISLS